MLGSLRRYPAMLGLMVVDLVAGALSAAGPLGAAPPASGRAATVAVGSGAAVESPAADPFYHPPSPLPSVAPGTVLRPGPSRSMPIPPG